MAPPTYPDNAENAALEIHQPRYYGSQLPSFSDDHEDNTDSNDSLLEAIDIGGNGPPSFQYPSMNFLIRQEDDGGILIEPASTSGKLFS